jgi:glycosyltransferase involved in cell wall biosynthesis
MNVLHVAPYFAPAWAFGGVPRAGTDLARAQLAAGHSVRVLTTDALTRSSRLPSGDAVVDDVAVTRVPNRIPAARATFNLSTPCGFAREFRRLNNIRPIEIVHCHELRTVENLAAASTAPDELPFVVSPHGTVTYETGRSAAKRAWDGLFAGRLLRRFSAVVALTPVEAVDVRGLWNRFGVALEETSLALVPNGVDAEMFTRLPDRMTARKRLAIDGDPVVLFVGRLEARKRLPFLVEAFAAAAKERPSSRLVIVGPDEGDAANIADAVERAGMSRQVLMTGLLSGDDRLAAYAAADLFVLPAVGEGQSLAVLEAMAAGLPVVLSPECNFPEAAATGSGVIVECHPDLWAGAIGSLIDDPDRRRSMGERGQALARSRYSWGGVAMRLDAVYQSAISAHRTRQ